jgi:hypothetical protein
MLDISTGGNQHDIRRVLLRHLSPMDQAAGGDVFGALARTNARPGRGAGSPAGCTTTGGGASRTATLKT